MKKNELRAYIPLSLAMLVPVPGRLAYGLVMIFLLFSLITLGTLFREFASKFFDDDLKNALIAVVLVSVCILVKQLVTLFSPLTALVLGISFFMPGMTPFVLGNLFLKPQAPLGAELKSSLASCGIFSAFALLFFLARDILAYGAISFPSSPGIFEIRLLAPHHIPQAAFFWASVPGAIILLVLCYAAVSAVLDKLEIIETSEAAYR
ncbi:MAG: hypothetical protein J6K96_07885 [Treponema sp.]|nr:hypothetical protein [Treponema sp.]